MSDKDNFFADYGEFINKVIILKKNMLERGVFSVEEKCVPPCEGFIRASIAPSNKHIRCSCKTCGRSLME